MPTSDIDEIHQAIGELIVFFQSIEDFYREIGWLIIDPDRKQWPPRQFRAEANRELIDKVTDLLVKLIDAHQFPNGEQRKIEANNLRAEFHVLRKYRNRIVHSAYHEVISSGESTAVIRIHPKIAVDPDSGEVSYDQEVFDPMSIRTVIAQHGKSLFLLHTLKSQVIHWHPFQRFHK